MTSELQAAAAALPPEAAGEPVKTLRDEMAMAALNGWLSSYGPDDNHPVDDGRELFVALRAYAMADAMLEARKKGGAV